jgi:PAS domain S-box-containing protein
MNVYAVVTLLSSILCSLFAAVVFCSNKKETLNRVFAVSGLAAAYLLFYYFMCLQAESASTAYVWMKLGSFWFFVISCYFHFVLVFTERKKLLKNALTYVLLYAPALFFALVNLTTDTFIGERYRYDWGGYSAYEMPQHPSWLHYVMVAWVIAMAAAGFALCLQYHIARKDRLVQKKSAIVLFSFTLPFLLTVVEEILILAQVKIRIPIIDVVSIVWLNAWMGYAIWKYDLFKIDPVKAAENIIATMPDTLVLVDRNGAIAGVNRSLLAMLDVAEQDLVGQPVSRLFAMESTSVAGGGIGERLLPGMEAENREAWLLTKDGRKIPVLLSVSAVRQRGINIGLVCVAKDITERKVAEELLLEANTRLQQSNRELQEFAHVASHDLQEPLRKIGIFGERLLETYRQAPEKEGRDHGRRRPDAAPHQCSPCVRAGDRDVGRGRAGGPRAGRPGGVVRPGSADRGGSGPGRVRLPACRLRGSDAAAAALSEPHRQCPEIPSAGHSAACQNLRAGRSAGRRAHGGGGRRGHRDRGAVSR